MALIDVSGLLSDPDFADSFTIYRKTTSVGNDGRTASTETAVTCIGVVIQGEGNQLLRLDDGRRISGAITVYTTTPLSSGTSPNDADEIAWSGNRYVVSLVSDWSNFGAGYYTAVCELLPVNPT